MTSEKNKFFFKALILIFVIFSLLLTFYNILSVEFYIQEKTVSTKAVKANVYICVDVPPPLIDEIPMQIATIGNAFNYTVDATSLSNKSIYYYDNTILFDINSTTGEINFIPLVSDIGVYFIEIKTSHDICPGIFNLTNMVLAIFPAQKPSGGGGGRSTRAEEIPIEPADDKPPSVKIILSNRTVVPKEKIIIFCSVKDNKNPIIRNVSISSLENLTEFGCVYNDSEHTADCIASYVPNITGIHDIGCTAWDAVGNKGYFSTKLNVSLQPTFFVPSAVCGDGVCKEDESYETCCFDCGCPELPGHRMFECIDNQCKEKCCFAGFCYVWKGLCWYWWFFI